MARTPKIKVYISGGRGRQSVRGPGGERWTKDKIRPKLAAYGYDLQTAPTHQTDIVVVPDSVRNPSKTTRSKIKRGTRVMKWDDFAKTALAARPPRPTASRHRSSPSRASSSRTGPVRKKQSDIAGSSGGGDRSTNNRDSDRGSVGDTSKKTEETEKLCSAKLRENIREMMRELRDENRWVNRKQALAVGYAKTRREHPGCSFSNANLRKRRENSKF